MNANLFNSTFIKPRPPPHANCVFARVIQSMDLHREAFHTNGWGGEGGRSCWAALRDTGAWLESGDGKKMRLLCTVQGQNGRFCHISKGMSLELLKIDYSKVGIRQRGTAGES